MKHHLRRPLEILGHHSEEPDAAHYQLQPGPSRRKDIADAGANNGKSPGTPLEESLKLQKQLRQLTHQVLVAQEDERIKLSHELQDEIAQTLLGLNVRLLWLKQAARSKAKGLKNEIASAQQLVVKSATLVRRLAHELDNHRPTPRERTVMAL